MTRASSASERQPGSREVPRAYGRGGYLIRSEVRPPSSVRVEVVDRSVCICPSPTTRGNQQWRTLGCPVHDPERVAAD